MLPRLSEYLPSVRWERRVRTYTPVQRSECPRALAAPPTARISYSPTERHRNRRIGPEPELAVADLHTVRFQLPDAPGPVSHVVA